MAESTDCSVWGGVERVAGHQSLYLWVSHKEKLSLISAGGTEEQVEKD